jgi:hypothetical protein
MVMGLFSPGLGLGAHNGKKSKISYCYFMRREFFVNLPMRSLTKKGREKFPLPFLVIFFKSWLPTVNVTALNHLF